MTSQRGGMPEQLRTVAEWVLEKVKEALTARKWLLNGATVVGAGKGDQHWHRDRLFCDEEYRPYFFSLLNFEA